MTWGKDQELHSANRFSTTASSILGKYEIVQESTLTNKLRLRQKAHSTDGGLFFFDHRLFALAEG
jgi:hypothetical protein